MVAAFRAACSRCGSREIEVPTLEIVVDYLKTDLIPSMNEKCKIKILLSLLRLIENDESIDGEEKEIFKSIFGLDKMQLFQQTEFVFSDFLAKTFLYVTNREIKNIKGQDCIKMFTRSYIEETLDAFTYDYEWKPEDETLILFSYEILRVFNSISKRNSIKYLIFNESPHVSYEWPIWDGCMEDFQNKIKSMILYKYNKKSKVVQKIQEYGETLEEYYNYIIHNTHISEDEDTAQYAFPNFEDKDMITKFSTTIKEYNKKLIQLYEDIQAVLFIESTVVKV